MTLIEQSPLGRIVVPEFVPAGRAVFYTTVDFRGFIDERLVGFVQQRFHARVGSCSQVHGAAVERVLGSTGPENGQPRTENRCDALWTTEPHVALAIKVADCLPVTLIDRDVIANIHSGWRGAVQGITAVTLDTLERETEFDPQSAYAYLGPSIRVCCFEVGEEVSSQFDERFVDRQHAKPHVDVPALTAALLQDRGVPADQVFDSGLCTRCDGSIFHSYRREGKGGGRNLAIVA